MNFLPFNPECFKTLKQALGQYFEDPLIDEICRVGKLKKFSADHIIMERGDPIQYIPIILEGTVKIYTEDKEGNELLLYYITEGNTCSMTLKCCMSNAVSTIQVIADTDCQIWMIPVSKFDDWMIQYKSWRNYVLESYHNRLNELLSAIDHLVFDDLEERLLTYIQRKVEINNSNELHVSHLDIARELHTSRVVVSRLAKKLVEEGRIEQGRNKILYLG